MYADDFEFNGQKASDYGLIIGSFDGELEPVTGGSLEVNAVQPPNNDKFVFYGGKYSEVLTWTFSVIKNPCKYPNDIYFNQDSVRSILKWLMRRDGYHWFNFINDDENIFYEVYIDARPHEIQGKVVGFDLTITSNCAYGFSDEITKTFTLQNCHHQAIYIDNDVDVEIFPDIHIAGSGNFYIRNSLNSACNSQCEDMVFENVSGGCHLIQTSGIIRGLNSPDDFNWAFLGLTDGRNYISSNASTDIEVTFVYRETRRVRV